jgi:hypothetical protein
MRKVFLQLSDTQKIYSMKIKLSFALFLFALFGMGVMNVQSQTVSLDIKNRDGGEINIDVNTLKKITFANGMMILNYRIGSVENIATSSIQKLVFTSFTGFNDLQVEPKTMIVFPNPTKEFISLKNIPDSDIKIVIYSINGLQMLTLQHYTNNEMIDISHLAKGIYLIKVNNQALKFTKL